MPATAVEPRVGRSPDAAADQEASTARLPWWLTAASALLVLLAVVTSLVGLLSSAGGPGRMPQ
jgi:hypothetical protein